MTRRFSRCTLALALAAIAVVGLWAGTAQAGTLYWDTSTTAGHQGGSGTWDTSSGPFWGDLAGTAALVNWTNGASNDAVFDAASASLVTFGANSITAGVIQFGNSNFTIAQNAGADRTLTYTAIESSAGSGTQTVTFDAAINRTLTLGSVIRNGSSGGTIALTKTGAGTLTLSTANTFTGGVTINAGAVKVTNATGLGPAANATVTFGPGSTGKLQVQDNMTIVGLNSDATTPGTPIIETGWNGDRTLTINNASASNFAGVIRNVDVPASGFNGALSLTKSGAGTLTLSGNNTYTGLTTINAGTLILSGNNTCTGGTTVAGGTLQIGHNSALGTGTLTISGGSTIEAYGAARTIANVVSITTASPVTISGSQDLTFSNFNLGALSTGGATLTVTNTGVTTLGGTINIQHGTSQARGLKIDTTAANVRVDVPGTITKTGSNASDAFTKAGAGLVDLQAANTYLGGTSGGAKVTGGVLRLSHATALPGGIGATGGTCPLTLDGGVVELGNGDFYRGLGTNVDQVQWTTTGSGGFSAYGATRIVSIGGSSSPTALTWNSGSFLKTGYNLLLSSSVSNATVDFKNAIDLNAAERTIQVGNGSADIDAKMTGVLSGAAGALKKTGDGTLELTNTNTYGGATAVSAGTLLIGSNAPNGSNGALGNDTSAVVVGDTSGTAAAALMTGGAFTIGRDITVQSGSSGVATLGQESGSTTGQFTGNITLNKAVTLAAKSGGTAEFSTGTWATNDNIVNVGKSGYAGTVKLSNTLTTAAAVNVNYGTFRVDGSVDGGGSNLTVANGATLQGVGSIGKPVVVNGTLSPGNGGTDTMSIKSDLTLAGSSQFKIGGSEVSSSIGGISTLTYGGVLNINSSTSSFAVGNAWLLFWFAERGGTSTFTNLASDTNGVGDENLPDLASGKWHFDYAYPYGSAYFGRLSIVADGGGGTANFGITNSSPLAINLLRNSTTGSTANYQVNVTNSGTVADSASFSGLTDVLTNPTATGSIASGGGTGSSNIVVDITGYASGTGQTLTVSPSSSPTTGSTSVTVNYNVGNATASTTGAFDSSNRLTAAVAKDESYANLASKVTAGTGHLATSEAILLAGTAGDARTVGMNWRTRTTNEATGGVLPGLPWSRGLISDVVDVTGTDTDTYVLQMKYDPSEIVLNYSGDKEQWLIDHDRLFLGYFDGTNWQNAGKTTLFAHADTDGFQSGTDNVLGKWGVVKGTDTVWVVVDHNSGFGVVPEPGTVALLALGGVGMLLRHRRRHA